MWNGNKTNTCNCTKLYQFLTEFEQILCWGTETQSEGLNTGYAPNCPLFHCSQFRFDFDQWIVVIYATNCTSSLIGCVHLLLFLVSPQNVWKLWQKEEQTLSCGSSSSSGSSIRLNNWNIRQLAAQNHRLCTIKWRGKCGELVRMTATVQSGSYFFCCCCTNFVNSARI